MKKRWFVKFGLLVLLMTTLAVSLCGCGGSKAQVLFQDAASDINSLWIYSYDGESGNIYDMYSDDEMQEDIVKKLSRVSIKEAEGWNHEKLTFPIYGMTIRDSVGEVFEVAWSNGYLITMDGTVYTFAHNFEKLISDYEWDYEYNFERIATLPCAKALSVGENGWVTKMLQPAEEPTAPEGISMAITKQEEMCLTIEITNNRTEECGYGLHYCVEALVDGVWYTIPTVPGLWSVPEIAIVLPAGKTTEETCELDMYGELPPGTYRLVKDGMTAEFEIGD